MQKIKLDKFTTMLQYSWHSFARELEHYDMAGSMHMLCPPRKSLDGVDLGGFLLNITPGVPFDPVDQNNLHEKWREQIAEIRRLGKPFDFWSIFECRKKPTGPGYEIVECQMPQDEYDYMIREVGDLFLGWEIGEWDGLYARDVVYYWQPEEYPKTRREAHDRLVEYLRDMHRKLFSNTNCLCGVTFAHYFNELPVRMLGAEVAQGLLNNQVYISFLRGACRQYNLQYKIMSSVFDRWGYRCYTDSPGVTLENETGIGVWIAGPHQGHSIGLLRAIWVTSYFAGAAIVGLDGSFYTDELADGVRTLSPLGEAFQEFHQWSKAPCPRGSQVRPVALMLDYYAGWAPPRHLYSFRERVVWHSLPYGPADHAMDQAYEMFYPGYSKAGFYRDERGFITPTPVGDVVDVLLSDASVEAMSDYPVIWLISDGLPEMELVDRLRTYVDNGGHLIVSGVPLTEIARQWFGLEVSDEKTSAITAFESESQREVREAYFSVRRLELTPSWHVHATTEAGDPLIASTALGVGRMTFLTADHGLTDDMTAFGFDMNRNLDYVPDPPCELLHSVQAYVKDLVHVELPVAIEGNGIYFSVNDIGSGEHIVCLYNSSSDDWTGAIKCRDGRTLAAVDGPWDRADLDGSVVRLRPNEITVFCTSAV